MANTSTGAQKGAAKQQLLGTHSGPRNVPKRTPLKIRPLEFYRFRYDDL